MARHPKFRSRRRSPPLPKRQSLRIKEQRLRAKDKDLESLLQSPDDLFFHPILNEFKTGRSAEEAFQHLCREYALKDQTVELGADEWLSTIKSDTSSSSSHSTHYHILITLIRRHYTLFTKATFYGAVDIGMRWWYPLASPDGRHVWFYSKSTLDQTVISIDTFHGTQREFDPWPLFRPYHPVWYDMEFMSNDRLIITLHGEAPSSRLLFASIDWTELTLRELHTHTINERLLDGPIFVDAKVEGQFVVFCEQPSEFHENRCLYGRVDKNGRLQHEFHTASCPDLVKLEDGRLYGIADLYPDEIAKLVVYDFSTRSTTKTALIWQDPDTGKSLNQAATSFYGWFGPTLYFIFGFSGSDRVYSFDATTLVVRRTHICEYGRLDRIHVDETGMLVILSHTHPSNKRMAVLRYALKSPDSLRNLCWSEVRRQALFFERDLCAGVELPSNLRPFASA